MSRADYQFVFNFYMFILMYKLVNLVSFGNCLLKKLCKFYAITVDNV